MRALVIATSFAVACGSDGALVHDARIDSPGGSADAAIDALPTGCDYVEQRDATNDDISSPPGTPEQTGLATAARTVVCGNFEHTHFDGDITVDIDGYILNVPSETDVLVRLYGAGVEGIEYAGVDVYGGASLNVLAGSVTFYGGHGVVALHLAAGTYELAPFALHSTAITATVPYRLEIVADTPSTRCPEVTLGGFAEANDGGSNTGNDVVTIPSGAPPALTTSNADMPEPTALTLAAAVNTRVTGSAADVATPDQYEDKDTFAFNTDASTNELAVRLTWPGTTANLDFFLFEAGDPSPVIRTIATPLQAPEVRTFSVKPSTSYWLLVGAKAGSTGFPIAYNASLCGAMFSP